MHGFERHRISYLKPHILGQRFWGVEFSHEFSYVYIRGMMEFSYVYIRGMMESIGATLFGSLRN